MKPYYEVFHKPSANMVAIYDTRREAIAYVKETGHLDVFRVVNDPDNPAGRPREFRHIFGPNPPESVR